MLIVINRTKRQRRIIEFLWSNEKEKTMENMINYINNCEDFDETYNKRTIEYDLNDLRKNYGVDITVIRKNRKFYYEIKEKDELPFIDEAEKNDFGFLFSLINTHNELKSVIWLKNQLHEMYGVEEKHFSTREFFSMPAPLAGKKTIIIETAMEIVNYAKRGQGSQFFYRPVGKEKKHKCVAPMHVRMYDGRFYLLALDMIGQDNIWNCSPKDPLIYSIDMIEGLKVAPAQKELDDPSEDDDLNIYFNFKKEAARIGLKSYFDHCIGISRPSNQSPKIIKLKFTDWAIPHVLNQPIHHSQKTISNNDKVLIVSVFVYDTFELEYSLGRYREFCKRI